MELIESVTDQLRSVMDELRPSVLDDYGLVPVLRWYGEQFAARALIAVSVDGETLSPRLMARTENGLFRIAQEALTNIAKHAQATQATLTMETVDDTIRLTIADDGVGFHQTGLTELGQRRGWGLFTMVERAEAFGGHCRIESSPGSGRIAGRLETRGRRGAGRLRRVAG